MEIISYMKVSWCVACFIFLVYKKLNLEILKFDLVHMTCVHMMGMWKLISDMSFITCKFLFLANVEVTI